MPVLFRPYSQIVKPLAPRVRLNEAAGHARGLEGLWLFREGPGSSKVWDLTRNEYHGTMTNMEPASDWTDSQKGLALEFGGTDEYVDVNMSSPADKTFLLLVNPASYAGGYNTLMEFANDQPWFGIRDSGKIELFPGGATTDDTLNTDEWVWVGVTSDATSGVAQCYINGLPNGSTGSASGATGSGLGIAYNGGDTAFIGMIAWAGVWNRALTAREMMEVYSRPYGLVRTARPRKYHWDAAAVVAGAPGYYYRYLTRLWGEA